MNFAQPLSAATFVSAAVRVVLPWSMWPMVPTFTCGLERSNFSLAMSANLALWLCPSSNFSGADDQNRTGDLVLTKDALCQLSYIGLNVFVSQQSLSTVRHARRTTSLDLLGGLPFAAHVVRDVREGWSGRRGSNPRPTAWKAVTLPLSYSRLRSLTDAPHVRRMPAVVLNVPLATRPRNLRMFMARQP